jgi:hypothetical protein
MSPLNSILEGERPTTVFKRLVAANRKMNNWRLAAQFVNHFDRVDSLARDIIWNWQRPGSERRGLDDEEVDAQLWELLLRAGYITAPRLALTSLPREGG